MPLFAIPNSHLCLIEELKNMLTLVPAQSDHLAFSIPYRSTLVPIHYITLQNASKTCIKETGLDPIKFSSHNFRRGGATWAFRSNVLADLIKVQGDWSSQAYMRYLDFSLHEWVTVAENMITQKVNQTL